MIEPRHMPDLHDGVSVVTPVFNCAETLAIAYQSVAAQTHTNWEWIIVDDGSTDNSLSVSNALNAMDERIRVIALARNSGAGPARNAGIREAQGRWLAFLDADDSWESRKLEQQIEFATRKKAYFTFTGFDYVRENGSRSAARVPERLTYEGSLRNTAILTSTVILDLTKIDRQTVMFPDVRRGQDTALWWSLLRTFGPAWGLQNSLTLYRQRRGSLSSNRFQAVRRTWALYRCHEDFSRLKSAFYFSHYLANAIARRSSA